MACSVVSAGLACILMATRVLSVPICDVSLPGVASVKGARGTMSLWVEAAYCESAANWPTMMLPAITVSSGTFSV